MLSAAALSSFVRPPKNRSSTTRALPLVPLRQQVQGVVERDQIRSTFGDDQRLVERHQDGAAAALLIAPGTCRVHENPPHVTCSKGKEVSAILPVHVIKVDQPQVDLVDERRRPERVVRPFSPQVVPRAPAQLVVDERRHALEGCTIASPPGAQRVVTSAG